MAGGHAVGIDVGTSGVRAVALGPGGVAVAQASRRLPPSRVEGAAVTQEPEAWWRAVAGALAEVAARVPVGAVAVDGTSGTMLLADAEGRPLGPVRMYNDASAGAAFAAKVAEVAPAESGAHGATSPLAWLLANAEAARGAALALHQADWVAGRLLGRRGLSDDNNALKTGWDPVARAWPAWIEERLGVRRSLLPEVHEPGSALGPVDPRVADELGLPRDCLVVAGTTDGCASFLATGASEVGDGVTALGSTLTLKLLSDRPVFDPGSGVYSHRLLGAWLAGGASNTGGAAIARHIAPETMAALEARLDPDRPTGLDYHPLPGTGERFPVNDPAMESRHGPRPADDAVFFQALLEGVAAVEAAGYRRLAELGAPPLRSVRTVGGGAANRAWARVRGRMLGVPMPEPLSLEAAHGTALLAARALVP